MTVKEIIFRLGHRGNVHEAERVSKKKKPFGFLKESWGRVRWFLS